MMNESKYIFFLCAVLFMACSKDDPTTTSDNIPKVYTDSTYNVKVQKGIEYAQGRSHTSWNSETYTTKSLTLDIYEPNDDNSQNRPVIVIFMVVVFTEEIVKKNQILKWQITMHQEDGLQYVLIIA